MHSLNVMFSAVQSCSPFCTQTHNTTLAKFAEMALVLLMSVLITFMIFVHFMCRDVYKITRVCVHL